MLDCVSWIVVRMIKCVKMNKNYEAMDVGIEPWVLVMDHVHVVMCRSNGLSEFSMSLCCCNV